MSTLSEIHAQIQALQSQAEAIISEQRGEALADIRKKMTEFRISLADIGGSTKTASEKSATRGVSSNPAPIKYRGPNGESWTGRGLTPRWLKTEIENGKTKESFLINAE